MRRFAVPLATLEAWLDQHAPSLWHAEHRPGSDVGITLTQAACAQFGIHRNTFQRLYRRIKARRERRNATETATNPHLAALGRAMMAARQSSVPVTAPLSTKLTAPLTTQGTQAPLRQRDANPRRIPIPQANAAPLPPRIDLHGVLPDLLAALAQADEDFLRVVADAIARRLPPVPAKTPSTGAFWAAVGASATPHHASDDKSQVIAKQSITHDHLRDAAEESVGALIASQALPDGVRQAAEVLLRHLTTRA